MIAPNQRQVSYSEEENKKVLILLSQFVPPSLKKTNQIDRQYKKLGQDDRSILILHQFDFE